GGVAELEVLADDLVDRPLVDELAVADAGHLDVEQVAPSIFLEDATGEGAGAIHLRVDRHESYLAREAADLQAPDEGRHRGHLPNTLGDQPYRCTPQVGGRGAVVRRAQGDQRPYPTVPSDPLDVIPADQSDLGLADDRQGPELIARIEPLHLCAHSLGALLDSRGVVRAQQAPEVNRPDAEAVPPQSMLENIQRAPGAKKAVQQEHGARAVSEVGLPDDGVAAAIEVEIGLHFVELALPFAQLQEEGIHSVSDGGGPRE